MITDTSPCTMSVDSQCRVTFLLAAIDMPKKTLELRRGALCKLFAERGLRPAHVVEELKKKHGVHVSTRTVERWESDDVNAIRIDTAEALAELLGLDLLKFVFPGTKGTPKTVDLRHGALRTLFKERGLRPISVADALRKKYDVDVTTRTVERWINNDVLSVDKNKAEALARLLNVDSCVISIPPTQDHVEVLLKKLFTAFHEKRFGDAVLFFHRDATLRADGESLGISFAGIYEGHGGILEFFQRFDAAVTRQQLPKADDFRKGDEVLLVGTDVVEFPGKEPVVIQFTHRVFFDMGLIRRYLISFDTGATARGEELSFG